MEMRKTRPAGEIEQRRWPQPLGLKQGLELRTVTRAPNLRIKLHERAGEARAHVRASRAPPMATKRCKAAMRTDSSAWPAVVSR